MGDISSHSAVVEAADLFLEIAPRARSKAERRLAVWRLLSKRFTFNRIAEIDRKSNRVVISVEELNLIREAAARRKPSEFQDMDQRLLRLEAELEELRAFRADLERKLAQTARPAGRSASRARDAARTAIDGGVVSNGAVGVADDGDGQ